MSTTICGQVRTFEGDQSFALFVPPQADVVEVEVHQHLTVVQRNEHGTSVGDPLEYFGGVWGTFTEWDEGVWVSETNFAGDCIRLIRRPAGPLSMSERSSSNSEL